MDKKSLPRLDGSCKIKGFADGISAAFAERPRCNEMATRSANNGRISLADEVLHYLINHERAQDTVEGIVAWWLPEQRIRYAVSEVEAVLRELVVSGFVIARKTSDRGIHYCINPSKEQAIRRRLEIRTARSTKA